MSEWILSKKDKSVLHLVHRLRLGCDDDGLCRERRDLCDEDEFLQCAYLQMDKGKTFQAHRHLESTRVAEKYIPQESWVVISGRVLVTYYDLDGSEICNRILFRGDCSITFRGGHNYMALDNDTVVYEYKTGPYISKAFDKEPI